MDLALMSAAADAFGQRLERVGTDQWTAATPCAGWDVRALVNHVVGELLWIPSLLAGETIEQVGDRFAGDVLGTDPLGTCRAAAVAAKAAAAATGAQERIVHLSFGDLPGAEYLGQVTADLTIHGWDLATALGIDDSIDPALLQFADELLAPQIELWRGSGAFGPEVDAGPGADAQARFLARTGRSSAWGA